MKRRMIPIYRKSSPRTGKDYDVKMIDERQLAAYLKRGYFAKLPKKKPKEEPETPPEPEKPKIRSIEKLSYADLTPELKAKILRAKKSAKFLANKFNCSVYAVNMTRKEAKK